MDTGPRRHLPPGLARSDHLMCTLSCTPGREKRGAGGLVTCTLVYTAGGLPGAGALSIWIGSHFMDRRSSPGQGSIYREWARADG